MQIEALITEIEKFSEYKLSKKDDLYLLIDLILENEGEKSLDDISFTSKYVMGLLRILKAGNNNQEVQNLEHIKKDFTDNMSKVTAELKKIIAFADDESYKSYFETEYLQMSHESLKNLNLLLSDLEWTKKYLNHKKRLN